MSIWWRTRPAAAETRSTSFPPPWMVAQSGYAHIDGSRIENAQQSVAVDSAVDLIASICSELPIDVYSGKGPDRKERPMPGYLEDPAGDGHGLADWIYQAVYSWLYRGNLFGDELSRSSQGFLQQVMLFHPDRVSGFMDDGEPVWTVNGERFTGRFLHRRVNPVPGQVLGQSPIGKHANTIGVSLAATRFGKGFFDSDAQPTGILRNTKSALDPDQAKSIKQKFMAGLRGVREPIVLGAAYEWQQISITPEESQFLGTMGYSSAECARIFGPGVPQLLGYETGGSLTYANIQDFDITLLKYSVNKWLRRLERLLFLFLPRPQYTVFNRDALLETSTMQRYLAYASALGGQPWKVVNEVREKENLPPVVWGKEPKGAPAPAPAPTQEPQNEGEKEPQP